MSERRRDRIRNKLISRHKKSEKDESDHLHEPGELEKYSVDEKARKMEGQVIDKNPSQPETIAAPNVVNTTAPNDESGGTDGSLWARAYDQLRKDEPELVEYYLHLLAATSGELVDTNEPAQVANVVKWHKEIMEKKQWRLVFHNHEIVIREKVDHIINAFRTFQGLGSAAAALDPIHAGIPWAGVSIFLQLVTNDIEQHNRVLDGLVFVTDLMNFYTQVESFYLSQDFKPEALIELYTLILKFQILAAGYFEHKEGSHFPKSPKSTKSPKFTSLKRFIRNALMLDNWSDLLEKVRNKDQECRKWMDVSDSQQITKKLDTLLVAVKNNATRAERILQWVSSISVRDQHILVRETKLGRDYSNNGRWLLEDREFCQWVQASSGIFYLEGGVGVGKSCLVSAVIEEHIKKSLNRLAFFYCSKGAGHSSDSLSILRSILAQLSYTSDVEEIPTSVQKRYDNRLDNVKGGSMSLQDCQNAVIDLASGNRPITIIIDALDECNDYDTLLRSLKQVYDKLSDTSSIHIFFSSRPTHVKVTDYFEPGSSTVMPVIDQSRQEMQWFIKTEIESPDRRLNSCLVNHPDLEKKFQDVLVKRAGAMFRWVELQLDVFLNKRRPIRHWKDFDDKLSKLISDPSLPTLTQAYDEIYASNVEPGDSAETYAIKTLQCILGAFQPLTIHQLVEAVAIDTEGRKDPSIDAPYIMDVCNNFIIVDRSNFVSLAHLSVREYLEQKRVDDNRPSIFKKVKVNRQLAECCLATLLHVDLGELGSVSHNNGFLQYAMAFWPLHCECIPNERISEPLSTLMATIMKNRLHDWAVCVSKLPTSILELDARLKDVPTETPGAYVVCAWGFSEFFSVHVQGIKEFVRPFGYLGHLFTPLDTASFYGHFEVVWAILYTKQADEAARTRALVNACGQGFYKVAELLLAAGADPGVALSFPFCGDFDHIVRLLIDHGANVNNCWSPGDAPWENATALKLASQRGHLNIVRALVDAGADINLNGWALESACVSGHLEVVKFLLDRGADVNVPTDDYGSPLLAAAVNWWPEIIRLLLEQGADPNVISHVWISPLQLVSSSEIELVQLMVSKGANVNGPKDYYGAPLVSAVAAGQLKIVDFLLDSGADINAHHSGKKTALVSAARYGHYGIVQLLLDRGVDVALHGPSACEKAAKHGHANIVELLLAHGAHQDVKQDDSSTSCDSDYDYE
ncbi:hypothetical protein BJX63DRAFT_102185 [Aspergillus granulosus]|uniref:NWD NACHT-NTPase N-terminal domain-containing protein n=1 Tax=Aspergillus granulosus TaxID=176169 RepID=A0ABR4HQ04_9EURO